MSMARAIIFFVISLTLLFLEQLASAEDENHFIYNGFQGATDLQLDGNAVLLPSGVLQLTNTSKQITGHAFHRFPLNLISSSFSTVFVIAMFSELPEFCGHGMTFVISQSTDFSQVHGLSSDHVFAVEFDTVKSPEFQDIDDYYVGVDVNNMISNLWIEYDKDEKLLTVSLVPTNTPKPIQPLLSTKIDFFIIFSEKMYLGFSSSTGTITSDHYVLGWSFSKSGRAQNLEIQKLSSVPPHGNTKKGLGGVKILIMTISALFLAIGLFIAGFKIWKKRCIVTREHLEENYGPQRFSFSNLYKSTRRFSITELLGFGGFGNVYRGEPSTNKKIAVKRISRCSEQGLQQFVAEIVNLAQKDIRLKPVFFMSGAIRFFLFLIIMLMEQLSLAQNEGQFIYNGFRGPGPNLKRDGNAVIQPNGILQLTNTSQNINGHAFYPSPLKFKSSSSGIPEYRSFSTNFVVAIVPQLQEFKGHGMAFVISPTMDFSKASPNIYLGLFNVTNNGNPSNHIVAVELDTVFSPTFDDIDDNHVGIDVNNLNSSASAPASYYSNGKNESLNLANGHPIQVWIEYDDVEKLLNVSLSPANIPKPSLPLLSTSLDLSSILLDYMYVGFSAATGQVTSDHYVLGWSFNKSGQSQNLDISKLPQVPLPPPPPFTSPPSPQPPVNIIIGIGVVLGIIIGVVSFYIIRKQRYKKTREDWEQEYGPQRFSFNNLYNSTRGFSIKELLGSGGFGNVYRGELPSTNKKIAVKRISRCSEQGLQQFVAEIVSMGRLKHRNLVQLYGYCRRGRELILVYDYMPNGSVGMYLFSNEKPNLSWFHRFKILRDIASALLYLHEEWEQVVLHRDVKASNVMLDADMNGRLGDFGLAKFYDHGTTTEITNVVGTVGYIAPELATTGIPTTSTDVFAFGAFMLEMACGRKAREIRATRDKIVLVDWVSNMFRRGNILQTCDPRLAGNYVLGEMELILKLGMLCSHSDPAMRPSVRQATQYLSRDVRLPEIPQNIGGIGALLTSNLVASDHSTSYTSSVAVDSDIDSILYIGR